MYSVTISGVGDASLPPFIAFHNEHGQGMAIWVATTLDMIPPGVVLINPQTGEDVAVSSPINLLRLILVMTALPEKEHNHYSVMLFL